MYDFTNYTSVNYKRSNFQPIIQQLKIQSTQMPIKMIASFFPDKVDCMRDFDWDILLLCSTASSTSNCDAAARKQQHLFT